MMGAMASPVRSCLRAALYRAAATSEAGCAGSSAMRTLPPVSQSSTCAADAGCGTLRWALVQPWRSCVSSGLSLCFTHPSSGETPVTHKRLVQAGDLIQRAMYFVDGGS